MVTNFEKGSFKLFKLTLCLASCDMWKPWGPSY